MDPIAVLQSRIEQLEAKLGLVANVTPDIHQGDTTTNNSVNAAQAVNNVTVGQEKLPASMHLHMASELNNYTEPILNDMSEQNNKHMQDATAAEPILHHCQCTHRFKQTMPVPESEPILQVPEMQATADRMHSAAAAAEIKAEADNASQGTPADGERPGAAAAGASVQPAAPAQQAELTEQKSFPRRRNGLD